MALVQLGCVSFYEYFYPVDFGRTAFIRVTNSDQIIFGRW